MAGLSFIDEAYRVYGILMVETFRLKSYMAHEACKIRCNAESCLRCLHVLGGRCSGLADNMS